MSWPSNGKAVDAGLATTPPLDFPDVSGTGSDAVGVADCDEIGVAARPPIVQPASVAAIVSTAAARSCVTGLLHSGYAQP